MVPPALGPVGGIADQPVADDGTVSHGRGENEEDFSPAVSIDVVDHGRVGPPRHACPLGRQRHRRRARPSLWKPHPPQEPAAPVQRVKLAIDDARARGWCGVGPHRGPANPGHGGHRGHDGGHRGDPAQPPSPRRRCRTARSGCGLHDRRRLPAHARVVSRACCSRRPGPLAQPAVDVRPPGADTGALLGAEALDRQAQLGFPLLRPAHGHAEVRGNLLPGRQLLGGRGTGRIRRSGSGLLSRHGHPRGRPRQMIRAGDPDSQAETPGRRCKSPHGLTTFDFARGCARFRLSAGRPSVVSASWSPSRARAP